MKRSILSAVLVCVVAMSFSGCASSARRSSSYSYRSARTIALAITVNGVLQPTPQQYAAIQAKAVRQFAFLGYTIVTDLTLAEQILRVNFIPNPNDPENSGHATVLGFRSNPYYATARSNIASRYPTSFGYAGSFSNTNWSHLNSFGHGYYGYGHSYYDGYSYSSPTLNPVQPTVVTPTKPVTPPYRRDSEYCPPDQHRIRPVDRTSSPDFVAVARYDSPPSSNREHGHRRGGGEGGGGGGSSGGGASTASGDSTPSYTSNSGSRGSWWGRATSNMGSSSNTSTSSSGSSRGSWWGRSDSSSSSARSEPSYSSSSSSSSSAPSYSSSSDSSSFSSSSSGSSSSAATTETSSSRHQN